MLKKKLPRKFRNNEAFKTPQSLVVNHMVSNFWRSCWPHCFCEYSNPKGCSVKRIVLHIDAMSDINSPERVAGKRLSDKILILLPKFLYLFKEDSFKIDIVKMFPTSQQNKKSADLSTKRITKKIIRSHIHKKRKKQQKCLFMAFFNPLTQDN